jgi:transporter family-2 protein
MPGILKSGQPLSLRQGLFELQTTQQISPKIGGNGMNLVSSLLALVAGAGMTLQAGVNGKLRLTLGSVVAASLINFLVGTVILAVAFAVIVLCYGQAVPSMATIKQTHWWMWMGGVCGVLYICSSIFVLPRIGFANMFCLVVAGEIALAVLLDHFGILGSVHPISPLRALGVVLMIISVYVIQTH